MVFYASRNLALGPRYPPRPVCITHDHHHTSTCLIASDLQNLQDLSMSTQSPARHLSTMTVDPYCEHLASPNGWVLALSV
jgi:hypothetical protein